jgi:Na+/H+-dicarboxylate symporter/ABC-type amino acid transport substrate-binding protein
VEIGAASGLSVTALLQTLIPNNITSALGSNFVPAIIVFAVTFGVAIQTIPGKAPFIEVMEVIRRASLQIWIWLIYLAPIGSFTLFAVTAGTIAAPLAGTLAVYIVLYLIGTLTLAFIVLPLALSAIAPMGARRILVLLQPALVLALVTASATAALPLIQIAGERLALRIGQKQDGASGQAVANEEAKDVTRATISLAFVFTSLGNYFTAFFIVYAAEHYRIVIHALQAVLLPILTLLSCSGMAGTTIAAVNFMSQWLGLPNETVSLYIEAMTITRNGQVVLSISACGFAAIAVLLVYFRRVSWRPRRAIAALGIGLAIFAGMAIGARLLSAQLFPPIGPATAMARTFDPALTEDVPVKVIPRSAALTPIQGPATIMGIHTRGVLRVGYGPDIIPFTYRNGQGELVGFDISYAYQLARDLHVRLEFAPIDWGSVVDDLAAHRFDIVMGAVYVTNFRLQAVQVTDSYYQSPLGLVAPWGKAERYLSYEAIAAMPDLTLGVLRATAIPPLASQIFPRARLVPLDSYDELPRHPEIDALLWSLEEARAWAAIHPGYSALRPSDIGLPLAFAYLLPPEAEGLTRFLNLWLSLQTGNGFREAQIAYWIRGEPRASRTPRWNLIDNVVAPALGP